MNFFTEIKRRNVYKVAVAYAVVAWLLIQIATQTFPFFDVPNWAIRLVILLVVIGFPIALVIAWAFELTPEGLKRTESDEPPRKPSGGRLWIYVVIAGGLLSAGLFFLGRFTVSRTADGGPPSGSPLQGKSIAVLPFVSLSEDKANAYFADGIQDEILTRLSKIAELKVISRTSTQQFQSKPGNVSEIARKLGVAHILEGSVQKSGDSVRVNVQLIKAEGDSHLWAETYDRKLTDIFAVETEVAQRIANSLAAKLTGREKEAINYVGTKITAAYDAYLRGIALRNSQSRQDQARLIQYCRQAVALDPNFAAPWADLAFAEGLRYGLGDRTDAQRALVKEAAENALRLDPDHGDGHAAMGMYIYYCLQDYGGALVELEKAREQAPNQPLAIQAIGLVKRRQGKLDECLDLLWQAAQIDPLNEDIWMNLAWSYRGMRRFADAHAMVDRAIAIAPNDSEVIVRKAEICAAEGDLTTAARLLEPLHPRLTEDAYYGGIALLVFQRKFDEAIAKITGDLAREEALPALLTALGHGTLGGLHAVAGRKEQAEPLLLQAETELLAVREKGNVSPEVSGGLLEIHALLGRRADVEREIPEHIAASSKDRWRGPGAEADAARAYSVLGDPDRALLILERLLVQPCADSLTPALLRFDPVWDPIRDDPRFQKLSTEKKP